ncbi:hypothetical protein L1987_72536 [Smallanthus sonchifolius]|uniref:Uncharacterized protein n=1 Tax=Smallanthus sonchifolius TaxID=185202 RepID=A0ACB9AW68_9ASTR|nr:hypothetical protein L1987_72536 [Smallanthus sonchifolius]
MLMPVKFFAQPTAVSWEKCAGTDWSLVTTNDRKDTSTTLIPRFKLVTKWNRNHFMLFKVEMCWNQKLHEWKQSPIPFPPSSRRSRSLVSNSKNIILSLCIIFQTVNVVFCKVIWLVATIVPIFVVNFVYRWKSFKIATRTDHIDEILNNYVLRIDKEVELAE